MPPKTKYELLIQRRDQLYSQLEAMESAYNDLVSGRITSYTLGNRTVSRNSVGLKELYDLIRSIENQIDEIESMLNGRSPRAVTRNSYLMPSFAPLFIPGVKKK